MSVFVNAAATSSDPGKAVPMPGRLPWWTRGLVKDLRSLPNCTQEQASRIIRKLLVLRQRAVRPTNRHLRLFIARELSDYLPELLQAKSARSNFAAQIVLQLKIAAQNGVAYQTPLTTAPCRVYESLRLNKHSLARNSCYRGALGVALLGLETLARQVNPEAIGHKAISSAVREGANKIDALRAVAEPLSRVAGGIFQSIRNEVMHARGGAEIKRDLYARFHECLKNLQYPLNTLQGSWEIAIDNSDLGLKRDFRLAAAITHSLAEFISASDRSRVLVGSNKDFYDQLSGKPEDQDLLLVALAEQAGLLPPALKRELSSKATILHLRQRVQEVLSAEGIEVKQGQDPFKVFRSNAAKIFPDIQRAQGWIVVTSHLPELAQKGGADTLIADFVENTSELFLLSLEERKKNCHSGTRPLTDSFPDSSLPVMNSFLEWAQAIEGRITKAYESKNIKASGVRAADESLEAFHLRELFTDGQLMTRLGVENSEVSAYYQLVKATMYLLRSSWVHNLNNQPAANELLSARRCALLTDHVLDILQVEPRQQRVWRSEMTAADQAELASSHPAIFAGTKTIFSAGKYTPAVFEDYSKALEKYVSLSRPVVKATKRSLGQDEQFHIRTALELQQALPALFNSTFLAPRNTSEGLLQRAALANMLESLYNRFIDPAAVQLWRVQPVVRPIFL